MRCLYDEPARGYERWQHEELAPIVTNRVLEPVSQVRSTCAQVDALPGTSASIHQVNGYKKAALTRVRLRIHVLLCSRSFTFMLNKRRRKSDVTCFDVAMYVVPEWGLCRPTVQVGFGVLGCNMKWTVHREET